MADFQTKTYQFCYILRGQATVWNGMMVYRYLFFFTNSSKNAFFIKA
jgi:hypothetical protein